MNYNRVMLGGRLTRDPAMSYLPSNTPVCEFGIAVNRKWKKDGEEREEVAFIDCRAFGKTAELINQHFTKGKSIFIEGRLKFDSWDGKDGEKRSKLYVVLDSFQFVGSRGDGAGAGGDGQESTGRQYVPAEDAAPTPPTGDDIPFGFILAAASAVIAMARAVVC